MIVAERSTIIGSRAAEVDAMTDRACGASTDPAALVNGSTIGIPEGKTNVPTTVWLVRDDLGLVHFTRVAEADD